MVKMYKINVWCLCFVLVNNLIHAKRRDYDKIGYFWHITDIHYDGHTNYHGKSNKGCWRSNYDGVSFGNFATEDFHRVLGFFGEYECDATWTLVESAANLMASQQKDVEFVLWTGDGLTHAAKHLHEKKQLEMFRKLTDLFSRTFSSQFVFPALGHDDLASRQQLGQMWARWLPTDSLKTFEMGGFYFIENKTTKLQIVVLNTNLMRLDRNDEEATMQLNWLEMVLNKFQRNDEAVYLVGHIPPGMDERQKGSLQDTHPMIYSDFCNKIYLDIIKKYHKIISGQFFGHLHSDTFRIIYSENGVPISWIMVSPSISPRKLHVGSTNPGLRLYKFNRDTGQIYDYTQYYLDLEASNKYLKPVWSIEYNFTTYYGLTEVTPVNLHNIANKFLMDSKEKRTNSIFSRYYKANSVRLQNSCDINCFYSQYCTVTRVDYKEHQECLENVRILYGLSSELRDSYCVVFASLLIVSLV